MGSQELVTKYNSDAIVYMIGSDVYIEKHFSKDHVKICPRSIFSSNQRLGLRDIVLKVQKYLKQDQKVVIDDDNGSFAKRSAYLKLIQKKFPEKTVALVSVFPKYGQTQVLWNQEVCLNQEDVSVSCLDITSWFDPKTGKVAYITNEEPDEEEGYKIFHHNAKLENFSPFKFDIPGLLIQIESIFTKSDSMLNLRQGVKDICVHWNEQNPLGRVIFIQFGNREPMEEIKTLLTKLAKQLDFPFYLFHIADPAAATPFSEPPNPGILAFLQKRHCLFLHSIKTVYIYNTQDHMKMAQAAGVNCVKITQILNNAALVNGSHVISRSPVPDFLRTMEILPTPQPPLADPTLPGMTQDRDWLNHYMKCELPQGRQEFIFARGLETVLRYQELYCSCVSKLAHPECIYAENHDREEQVDTGTNTSLNSSTRKLPSWMLGKETTPIKQSLLRTDSTSSTEGQIRQTIYVMNEEELLEVARDVLKQTGKSEVLKNLDTSFSHDEKTRNKSVQKKIDTRGIKRKSPSVKRHAKVLLENESDSDCPGTSGWKPSRGSECDKLGPGDSRIGSKCAVLDDLMTETDLRRASPRKTRRGIQAQEDEQQRVQFTSSTSKLSTKFSDYSNAKKGSNYFEKDCEKSGSVKIRTRNSQTSPKETSTSAGLNKTKKEDTGVFLPNFQEPHASKDFTSTHYNFYESRNKNISSKGITGLHEPKTLRSKKDSTVTKTDYNERLKVPKTEKKPDLSILDEIFF